MKKFYVVGLLLMGTAGLLIGMEYLDQPEDSSEVSSHEVWDCTFDEADTCIRANITEYQSCLNEEGVPEVDACRTTDEGIEHVSMFTDPGNYIKAPMTEEEYSAESLDIGNNNVWDAEFIDEDRMIYTEQDGTVVVHDGDEVLEQAELEGTSKFGNTGLLGVAVDPNYEENNRIFLYYYKEEWREHDQEVLEQLDPIYNRVSSFELVDGELRNENVLIDDIEGSSGHSGGRLSIGPDERLYVTTGDSEYVKTEIEELHRRIQDRDFLGGKVLRTELDGEVPGDNPFDDSYVYAEGLRNPQGIDFHPETGNPYVSMHGPWRYDEVNRIEAGENYGWPAYRCDQRYKEHVEVEDYQSPEYCFDEWTIAPSGTTFIDDESHEWYGSYFVTGLRGSMLYRLELSDEEVTDSEVFYIRENEELDNRLRHVEFNGESLYLFGDGHGVGKLTPE